LEDAATAWNEAHAEGADEAEGETPAEEAEANEGEADAEPETEAAETKSCPICMKDVAADATECECGFIFDV
jgi:hypothetical protein